MEKGPTLSGEGKSEYLKGRTFNHKEVYPSYEKEL